MIPRVILDIWAVREFRDYWIIGLLTSTARWLEIMSFSVISWELSGDAVHVGWMFSLRMIFMLITGLVFSMLGNRFSGVRIMLVVNILVGLNCLIPVFMNFFFINFSILPFLYAISIFSGILWSVDFSFRRRLLGDALAPELVGAGVSLDVLSSHATRLFGMIFGGFILSMGNNDLLFIFLACLYFLSLLPYRDKKDRLSFQPGFVGISKVFGNVFTHAFKNIPVLIVLSLTPIFNIFILPFFTLISLLFLEKFKTSELVAGTLSSLEGFGALIGGLLITIFYPRQKVFTFCFMIFILLVCVLFASALQTQHSIMLFIFFAGGATSCYSALQSSIIYTFTEENLRSSTYSVLTISIGTGFLGAINVAWLGKNLSVDEILFVMSMEGIALSVVFLMLIMWRRLYTIK